MGAGAHLILQAFEMNSVGHLAHGLWRHPRDRATEYTRLDYWLELARTLEAGLFDGLFLADVTGVYDVWGGNADAALHHAIQVPVNEPALLVPAMASVTRHLGFGVTAVTGVEPPHLFARRFSTLDHLTDGRIAWNIVTGFLDSAARATGAVAQEDHDQRYDRADDYLAVLRQLWEHSWQDGAVLRDRASGAYADPRRVQRVAHRGPYYQLDAIHLSEPSPQRTPVLFQAGASGRGQAFAARHAECIFVPNRGRARTAQLVAAIRQRIAQAGRDPASVRVLTTLQVVTGETDAQARARFEDYRRYAQPQAALAQLSSAIGVDLSGLAPDAPIPAQAGNGIQSLLATVTGGAGAGDAPWTVARLLAQMPLGGFVEPLVGSGPAVAQALIDWADATGVDGFNLVRTVSPEGLQDFIRWVVPALQEASRFKTAYAPGTLREKLLGVHAHPLE